MSKLPYEVRSSIYAIITKDVAKNLQRKYDYLRLISYPSDKFSSTLVASNELKSHVKFTLMVKRMHFMAPEECNPMHVVLTCRMASRGIKIAGFKSIEISLDEPDSINKIYSFIVERIESMLRSELEVE